MPDNLDPTGTRLTKGADWRIIVVADDAFDFVDTVLFRFLSTDRDITDVVNDRIFAGGEPEGVDVPYLWYDFVAADDDILTYGTAPAAPLIYHIELVDVYPNYDRLTPAYKRFVPLLHNLSYEDGDGAIVSIQRARVHRAETPI